MRYTNRLILTNPLGVSHTLRAFSGVSISESEDNPIKSATIEAQFIENQHIISHHTIGSTLEIYSKREDELIETKMFHGYVSTVPRTLDQNVKKYSFSAECLLGKTQKILINESFVDMYVEDVVKYLMNNFTNFFDTFEISGPMTKVSLQFKEEFLFDCLNKIAEAAGCRFYADGKTFKFFENYIVFNQNEIRRGMFEKGSAKFEDDSSQMVNHLRGVGNTELSRVYRTDRFFGNGTTRQFITTYSPDIQPINLDIYKDDVLLNWNPLNESNGGEVVQAYVDHENRSIEFVEAPLMNEEIRVVYKYQQRIIIEESDENSIEQFGLYMDILRAEHISSRDTLRTMMKEKIQRYKTPILSGTVNPFKNVWNVRELVNVNISDLGVNRKLIITQKNINIEPNILKIQLNFEHKPNLVDILKNNIDRIRELEKNQTEAEGIDKFKNISEKVSISESFTLVRFNRENSFRIGISTIGGTL